MAEQDIHKQSVKILFQDQEISDLFSELLQAHGASTEVISDCNSLSSEDCLITETHYVESASLKPLRACIIVGDDGKAKNSDSWQYLTQPLTEHKVEKVLEKFLSTSQDVP